jgi:hypothetical protein
MKKTGCCSLSGTEGRGPWTIIQKNQERPRNVYQILESLGLYDISLPGLSIAYAEQVAVAADAVIQSRNCCGVQCCRLCSSSTKFAQVGSVVVAELLDAVTDSNALRLLL